MELNTEIEDMQITVMPDGVQSWLYKHINAARCPRDLKVCANMLEVGKHYLRSYNLLNRLEIQNFEREVQGAINFKKETL